jgi:hypothetical protein
MDLAAFRRLLTPEGQGALAAAVELQPTDATLLSVHQRLRKQFPADLARAAVETVVLRQKARGKFTKADQMYFTREALEQSSGEVIATYRAGRFAAYARVGDFCCGIGGDLIGLAGVTDVVAIEADPLRLAMAEENLKAYGRAHRATFIGGDLLTVPLPDVPAAFFDPDRRAGGRRHVRLDNYVPPLDAVRDRLPAGFPLGVKVAPAVSRDELARYDAEAEFISVDGELKECVLWLGPLATMRHRATVLPLAASLFAPRPADPSPPGPPLAYLYDPDPAVVRSGLVANLGEMLGGRPIDADIAYLATDRLTPTPFARAYQVEEALPFHARRLGERLRSLNVGPVTITKRGSAVAVDELRRGWKLTGAEQRTVVLTRVLGQPFALITRPVTTDRAV